MALSAKNQKRVAHVKKALAKFDAAILKAQEEFLVGMKDVKKKVVLMHMKNSRKNLA
jgi:hypothetical protein